MAWRSRRNAFARGIHFNSALYEKRAQGMPGARCTRSLAYDKKQSTRVSHHRLHRFHPAFPTQWVTDYGALSPVRRAFWPPSLRKVTLAKLDTSVGVSGPHAFSVRSKAPSSEASPTSIASRPALMTLRKAPLVGRDGESYRVIWLFRKTEFHRSGCDKLARRAEIAALYRNSLARSQLDLAPAMPCGEGLDHAIEESGRQETIMAIAAAALPEIITRPVEFVAFG